ncbi:hypothetical protein [Aquirufa sp. ROCK2-A2]
MPKMTINQSIILRSKIALIFIFLFFVSSCNNSNPKKENALSSKELEFIKEQNDWDSSSEMVKKITHSAHGIVRGVQWGQKLEQIKESVELSEVQPNQGKSFTQYLDDSDLNFVDITYSIAEDQKVSQITLDVFLENQEEVGNLNKELINYLNVKFGDSQNVNKKTVWNKNKNTQIILEDVSTSKDPGIKLIFSKKN